MELLLSEGASAQLAAIAPHRAAAYLFQGGRSVGKMTAASVLARRLNCLGNGRDNCPNCLRFEAGSYPDYIVVRPVDKPSIAIEQVRNLIHTLSLERYYPSGTRIVIIDEAHALTDEAQNALLKLIEEPPKSTLFILVTDQPQQLFPTVRSRCAEVFFAPVATTAIAELLEHKYGCTPARAAQLARSSHGCPGQAARSAQSAAGEPDDLAARVQSLSLFDRLMLVPDLLEHDPMAFAAELHARVTARFRAGTPTGYDKLTLDALERYRRFTGAKVAPKVALEALMVEIGP